MLEVIEMLLEPIKSHSIQFSQPYKKIMEVNGSSTKFASVLITHSFFAYF